MSDARMPFRMICRGRWTRGQVSVRWIESTHRIPVDVQRVIDESWSTASARLGEKLFDGPMCRLERCNASPAALELSLSRTSYKPFLGTNLYNADLADRYRP